MKGLTLTLERLQKMASEAYTRNRQRKKEHYRLARSLGFPTSEAVVLQNHPEATIRRLAAERGK